MMRMHKNGEIHSVEDWFAEAPPKRGIRQWADGRSAKELARAWFPAPGEAHMPEELQTLLDSRPETRQARLAEGEPERVTVFDRCGGEGRNADLVFWGSAPGGRLVACVEAKADEPFGEVSGEYVDQAAGRNPRSRVPERFELLCRGVLGLGPECDDARGVRYQLLTAVAGTLVEAEQHSADVALFIVHEFLGRTDPAKVAANAADLDRFVTLLSRGSTEDVPPGTLVGPFSVPGNAHFGPTDRLFVGKCRRHV